MLKQRNGYYDFIDISMAKGQKSREVQTAGRGHHSKTNIGRPEDDKLQTFFMKKLRNGKLQVITAQSQAQIACYNSQNRNNSDENNSEQKVAYIKKWFEQRDQPRFKLLWKVFLRAAEKWQFKEINSISDFPEFLFCDECDLSYVLFEALNSDVQGVQDKKEIFDDQLLYFQLLCFATRDQVSFKILRTLQKEIQLFLKMMEPAKEEVVKCSKEISKDQKSQNSDNQNDEVPSNLRKGEVTKTLSKINNEGFGLNKTKLISKSDKANNNDKKRGRPKKPNLPKQDDLLEEAQFITISQKLISHIVRAYAYIYSSEVRKNELRKGESSQQQSHKQQIAED